MSRTDIDAATLANYLRQMCGDGSVEWSYEPMQTSVLLDIADMLDENTRLREQLAKARDPQRIGGTADPESFVYAIEQLREFRWQHATNDEEAIPYINNVADAHERENAKLRKMAAEMYPYAKAFLRQGVMLGCNDSKSYDWFLQLSEMGIEVEP